MTETEQPPIGRSPADAPASVAMVKVTWRRISGGAQVVFTVKGKIPSSLPDEGDGGNNLGFNFYVTQNGVIDYVSAVLEGANWTVTSGTGAPTTLPVQPRVSGNVLTLDLPNELPADDGATIDLSKPTTVNAETTSQQSQGGQAIGGTNQRCSRTGSAQDDLAW